MSIYKIEKSDIQNILNNANLSYKKIKSRDVYNSRCYEIYFSDVEDLLRAVNRLNMREYSHLYFKISDQRISSQNLMIYVVPFKKI